MAESLFTSQVPEQPDAADGTDSYSMGTYFVPAVDGVVTHIRWYMPASAQPGGAAVKAALFRNGDQVKISTTDVEFDNPGTPGAWNQVALPAPVAVLGGSDYCATIWTPRRYVSTSGAGSPWPLTNGNLSAPADAGRFVLDVDGTVSFPTGTFASGCYFVDVVFVADGSSTPITPKSWALPYTVLGAITAKSWALPYDVRDRVTKSWELPYDVDGAQLAGLAAAREEIRAALAGVAGVNAFAERPSVMAVGSAWPRWRGLVRSDGATGLLISAWQAVVVVGKTEQAATDFVDQRADELAAALRPAGYLTGIEPYLLATDQGDLFAVQVSMTRE